MKTQMFEDELYYVCHDGRELHHIRTETKTQAGYTQTFEVYGCADCSGCEYKTKCLSKYHAEKVYKEFMLYAVGRNINKYHRFLHDKIQNFEGKTEEKTA